MGFSNAYSVYRDTSVKTASQGKLIVLLYEGAIRHLTAAAATFGTDTKIQPAKIEDFGNHIMKAQEIINELQVSLDMNKGGEISKNLMSLYVFFNKELMTANITKDKKKIEFVLSMMTQLNTAWETAASSTANKPAASTPVTLNITG